MSALWIIILGNVYDLFTLAPGATQPHRVSLDRRNHRPKWPHAVLFARNFRWTPRDSHGEIRRGIAVHRVVSVAGGIRILELRREASWPKSSKLVPSSDARVRRADVDFLLA